MAQYLEQCHKKASVAAKRINDTEGNLLNVRERFRDTVEHRGMDGLRSKELPKWPLTDSDPCIRSQQS